MMNTTNDSKSHHNWVASHIASLPRSGIRDFFELVMSMDDIISLGVGEPDFVTPWGIREASIYGLQKGHTNYTSNLGLLSLRTLICEYVSKNYEAVYDPRTECIITVGVSEALDLILRAIIEPGDEILYHEPCYVSYPACISMCHGRPVSIRTLESDNFALNPDSITHKITEKTKALLINFPNNPTGANLSYQQKEQIAELAIRHNLVVITDEIYSELTYGNRCKSIAAFPGMKERTIFLHGFSKAYAMTGYRIGYACGPKGLIDAMMKIHQYSMLCASIIGQEAAIEALKSGQSEMESMREEYLMRRNVIVENFNDLKLPCAMPEGAFYVFPNISSTGLSSDNFARRLLEEERVAVVPGTAFSQSGSNFIRCSYATSMEDIEKALSGIARFVSRIRTSGKANQRQGKNDRVGTNSLSKEISK